MKKLFIIFAILCLAVPAMADDLKFTYTVDSGTPDHLVFHHAPWTGATAQEFMDTAVFTDITAPAGVQPIEFSLNYPNDSQYGIWVEVFDAMGNSTTISDNLDGNISPTVWRFTAIPQEVDAHVIDISPTGDTPIIINIMPYQER